MMKYKLRMCSAAELLLGYGAFAQTSSGVDTADATPYTHETFRRTRRATDRPTWPLALLSFVLELSVFSFTLAACLFDGILDKFLCTALAFLFLTMFVWSMDSVFFPYEQELVVEDDCIRWGDCSKPARQHRLPVRKIKRIIHETQEHKVLADTGGFMLCHLCDRLLMSRNDQAALVEHLRTHFPQLTIETRGF